MSSNLSSHSTSKGPVFNPLSPENEGKLDPAFVKYYNEVIDTKQAAHQVPLEEVRAHPQEWGPPWTVPVPDSDRIRPDTIPSKDGYQIPVRMYHPDPSNFGPGPYCVHLNFHGGGFVYGGLVQDGKFCVTVQEQSGLLVIDINYRHCPEVPYGKNIEDAWAALNWVSINIPKPHLSRLN
jgi:acetyl esterase/lipase